MDEEITITMKEWQWAELLVDLDCLEDSERLELGSLTLRSYLYEQGVKL